MAKQSAPNVRSVLPLTIMLSIPGWAWLIYLITNTSPNIGNRWMFFAAVVVAVTGTAAPLVAVINRMMKSFAPATFDTILRESIMVGVFTAALLWLNKGQVLSLGLALILGSGFLLVELLLRLRARSEWHPGRTDLDTPPENGAPADRSG